MKKVLLNLLVIFPVAAMAQPTITSSIHPANGTTISYTEVDATSLTEGSAGTSQSWNFASASPVAPPYSNTYIAAAGTPFAASFPSANVAVTADDGSGDPIYSYYNHSASSTQMYGYGFTSMSTTITNIYSDPQTVLSYPMSYNSSFTDNFAGSYSIVSGPLTLTTYRTGTITSVGDAYGNLTTPLATYPSVLRMKTVQQTTDSTVYVGVPLPPVVLYVNSTTYNWTSAGSGDKLNQFYISYDTVTSQGTPTPSKTALYQSAVLTSVNSFSPSLLHSSSYPNPTVDYVTLELSQSTDGVAELFIYDIQGREVKTFTTDMRKANRFEWMFPVMDLPPGIYSAIVRCNNNKWQQRIVKQ
jgi:hypothetical protein